MPHTMTDEDRATLDRRLHLARQRNREQGIIATGYHIENQYLRRLIRKAIPRIDREHGPFCDDECCHCGLDNLLDAMESAGL